MLRTLPTVPVAVLAASLGWSDQLLLVVCFSEFVGCSPSLSGAIRVNPWSVDAVADAMFSAIKTTPEHRKLRHDKHWK